MGRLIGELPLSPTFCALQAAPTQSEAPLTLSPSTAAAVAAESPTTLAVAAPTPSQPPSQSSGTNNYTFLEDLSHPLQGCRLN